MAEPKAYIEQLDSLRPDPKNANKGTERGAYVIRKSLEQTGAGRSLVIDKDGVASAGSKTLEALADLGFEQVIIVETDGTIPVAVKRIDWDMMDDDPANPARRYAYYDNRASELGFQLDVDIITEDLERGVDLSDMYRDKEIDKIIAQAQALALDDMEEVEEGQQIICPKCGMKFVI